MATPAQINANRRNAQSSSGPTTEDGKARCSRNRLSHGLFAEDLVLVKFGEKIEDFQNLLESLQRHYSPVGPVEESLVRDIATCGWRHQRLVRAETHVLSAGALELKEQVEGDSRKLDDYAVAGSFMQNSAVLNRMSIYETRLLRSRDRALDRLACLQKNRKFDEATAAKAAQTTKPPAAKPAAKVQTVSAQSNTENMRNEPNFPQQAARAAGSQAPAASIRPSPGPTEG